MTTHQGGRHGSWYANILNGFVRLFGFIVFAMFMYTIYAALISDFIDDELSITGYIALWLLTSYFVLPRLYRFLSRFYFPRSFFGRARTSDGLLGDPVNLVFIGEADHLVAAMTSAGWTQADRVNIRTSCKIILAVLAGRNYASAPVSPLFLFGRKQSYAFQRSVHGSPRKRHHVRLWRTPDDWWLPGGYQVDWLAAATFDRNVGLSLFTGQITHKIDANVDQERDYLLTTLREAGVVKEEFTIEHFTSGYYSRNGGGDIIHTDGALPFVTLGATRHTG